MAATTNKWIEVAWINGSQKEQIPRGKVEAAVLFDKGSVIIGKESYTKWKEARKNLKKILNGVAKRE